MPATRTTTAIAAEARAGAATTTAKDITMTGRCRHYFDIREPVSQRACKPRGLPRAWAGKTENNGEHGDVWAGSLLPEPKALQC